MPNIVDAIVDARVCTKCGKSLPLTVEFWHRMGTDFKYQCKACEKLRQQGYYQRTREARLAYQHAYYEAETPEAREKRLERTRERMQEYYQRNREERLAYQRRYNKGVHND